jgi:hypothetical protein
MSDSYSSTTSRNYFQRLGDSFGGMAAGLVMIVVACSLLWWNESRSVEALKGIGDARGQVVRLESAAPDAANKDKLVHVSGKAEAKAAIADADLGISFNGALAVGRKVEMYQWVETCETKTTESIGGTETKTETCNYSKDWKEGRVDSKGFKKPAGHENPNPTLASKEFFAADAVLGGFKLGEAVLAQIPLKDGAKPAAPPAGFAETPMGYYASDTNGMPESPQIGDLRVTYASAASGQTISVLGRQTSDGFGKWENPSNGYTILSVAEGEKTAAMMLNEIEAGENMLTWILRAVGVVLNCMGFGLILAPLKALANFLPFLASIVGGGAGIIAFALGVPLSLIVIAIAWLAFRPLIGGAILAAGIGLFGLMLYLRRGKGAAKPAPA